MADVETPDDDETSEARPAFDRRSFVKRIAIGTAFAVPVVTSFSMTGVNSAYAAQAVTSNG